MKKLILIACLCLVFVAGFSQSITTQAFTVGGDFDKFHPVIFSDGGWSHGATELEISRSSVHTNSTWRGSLISKFRFHTTRWGHGSNFIDADIRSKTRPFIADWKDATGLNNSLDFIIWMRGGTTTYYFRSSNTDMPVPRVYDGIHNPLPFQQVNGVAHSYKTDFNSCVNQNGLTYNHEAYFNGGGKHFFGGKLEIGYSADSEEKLLVRGNASVDGVLKAREIKVEAQTADFVFEPDYNLRPLYEVEAFVKTNKHLPEIPSAKQMKADGVNVAEMNKLLLQKVEELTLYILIQDKRINRLEKAILKSNL